MNSMKLKQKIKEVVNEKAVNYNVVLRMYMYERFIERLAVSKYRDNFILKGGFYLSTFFGVDKRTTMDIDTAIKGVDFTKKNMKSIIEEIISIDIKDGATIELCDISDIRKEDKYGGYRFDMIVHFENIKEKFQIDIATGDPITPSEIEYNYNLVISNKIIKLWSYNMETVLAEKLETILSRGEANGRTRDYYDIFLIYKLYFNNLKNAIMNTFKKREFNNNILDVLKIIKESEILEKRWISYQKKYEYARGIDFRDIVMALEELLNYSNLLKLELV